MFKSQTVQRLEDQVERLSRRIDSVDSVVNMIERLKRPADTKPASFHIEELSPQKFAWSVGPTNGVCPSYKAAATAVEKERAKQFFAVPEKPKVSTGEKPKTSGEEAYLHWYGPSTRRHRLPSLYSYSY